MILAVSMFFSSVSSLTLLSRFVMAIFVACACSSFELSSFSLFDTSLWSMLNFFSLALSSASFTAVSFLKFSSLSSSRSSLYFSASRCSRPSLGFGVPCSVSCSGEGSISLLAKFCRPCGVPGGTCTTGLGCLCAIVEGVLVCTIVQGGLCSVVGEVLMWGTADLGVMIPVTGRAVFNTVAALGLGVMVLVAERIVHNNVAVALDRE